MQPVLQSANIFLKGNFNPYIVSPQWLDSTGIWSCKDLQLGLGAIKDGVQFRSEDVEWFISHERLQIASRDVDCGVLAASVLKELPHTPMYAVGSNFSFAIEGGGMDSESPIVSAMKSTVPTDLPPKLFRWGIIIHEGPVRMDISFVIGEQTQNVAVNCHRGTANLVDAMDAARRFSDDKKNAESKVEKILKEAIPQ